MPIENHLNALIQESAVTAKSFTSPQSLPKNPNPLRLCKWYEKEVELVTQEIDILEQNHSCHCTCSKGCFSCCYQLIAISYAEHLMLEFKLNNLSSNERTRIKKIVTDQCTFLSKHGYSKKSLLSQYLSDKEMISMQQDFFSFHLPCPLLDCNGECSIYTVRPTSCWSYRSYGDPTACSQSWDLLQTIKYDDWDVYMTQKLFNIKKPTHQNSLVILQFSLLDILTQSRF